jgi:hypothetical protein
MIPSPQPQPDGDWATKAAEEIQSEFVHSMHNYNGDIAEIIRRHAPCPYCEHPLDAHRPMCLVFIGEGQACECYGHALAPAPAPTFAEGAEEMIKELQKSVKDLEWTNGWMKFALSNARERLDTYGIMVGEDVSIDSRIEDLWLSYGLEKERADKLENKLKEMAGSR